MGAPHQKPAGLDTQNAVRPELTGQRHQPVHHLPECIGVRKHGRNVTEQYPLLREVRNRADEGLGPQRRTVLHFLHTSAILTTRPPGDYAPGAKRSLMART